MRHDLLGDIFETLRLRGRLSFVAELRAEDAVAVPAERQVVRVHLVRHGACTVAVPGHDPVALAQGDLALIPHGAAQVLRGGDAIGEPMPLVALLDAGALIDGVLRTGDGLVGASLLCGYCEADGGHPILEALPPAMVLQERDLGGDPWAAAALRLLTLEAGRMGNGAGAILTRTIEVLLIQAVRRAATGHETSTAFLVALADRPLARALAAIHRDPAAPWTLPLLAREAGLSRTVFAARFAKLVGQPPATYLASWRLTLAAAHLRRRDMAVEEIAERVGYASPAAFARRFKAAHGLGPGAWRKINSQ
ncbi:AraC family transcriptional regulator [Jannaschia sp. LMIT008]|uniref:AraC family transcriptional regulator n=1 Tax=Jannaschia maritima TaxID=3032585 RepID=UPI00281176CF|nr:AraC family transcriptional regulator [Jannaschia sp. LMIT008]